jgi:hypothetical protein
MFLFILASLIDAAAFAFTSQSLLTCLTGLTLVCVTLTLQFYFLKLSQLINVFLAPLFDKKEKAILLRSDGLVLKATFAIVLGVILVCCPFSLS